MNQETDKPFGREASIQYNSETTERLVKLDNLTKATNELFNQLDLLLDWGQSARSQILRRLMKEQKSTARRFRSK